MPFLERIEDHEHRAEVRTVGPHRERHAANPQGVAHALRAADDLVDVGHGRVGPLQRGRVGQLDHDVEEALVLLGNEADRHLTDAPRGQIQQAAVDQKHHDADAKQLSHRERVARHRQAEALVEQPEEPAEAEVEDPGERIDVGVPLLSKWRRGPG